MPRRATLLLPANLVRRAEELLDLREQADAEATLRQVLADCTGRQAQYRQALVRSKGAGEELVRGLLTHLLALATEDGLNATVAWARDDRVTVVYPHDAACLDLRGRLSRVDAETALLVFLVARLAELEADEENLRAALLDLLGQERRPLTAAEAAFLDRYEAVARQCAAVPPQPTGHLPGSPEKLATLEARAHFSQTLFAAEDLTCADLADAQARVPVHAQGNFALLGSVPLPEAQRKLRRQETLAQRCRRWVADDLRRRSPASRARWEATWQRRLELIRQESCEPATPRRSA